MKRLFTLVTILCIWASVVCAQGKYMMEVDEAPESGSTIKSVPGIVLTFGGEGNGTFRAAKKGTSAGEFSVYTSGLGLSPYPCYPNGEPKGGTFYKFDVKKNGTLEVYIVLNADKEFFILEDGTPMTGYNGKTVTTKYYGSYKINVKKGSQYHIYCKGSNLGFYGFIFDVPAEPKLTAYDFNRPLGWGSGVTGSENANKVTVTTRDALEKAMKGTAPKTIYIKGTIELASPININEAANKTVYGIDNATLYNNQRNEAAGCMQLRECDNIIIRNVTFKGEGAFDIDGNDNLTLKSSTNIWIDHCEFLDGIDGNLDCVNGSDNICISWCRFRYTKESQIEGMTGDGSGEHRYSNLWGGSDGSSENEGKLNTTFVSCWWDQGCVERMPRVRDGKVHVVNCYYNSSVAKYYIGIGSRSKIFVENCHFNVPKKADAYRAITAYDNSFRLKNCIGVDDYEEQDGVDYFTPTYEAIAYSASEVKAAVTDSKTGAGPTLDIKENEVPTGTIIAAIREVNTTNKSAVFDVYTLSGVKIRAKATSLEGLPHGIYIVSGRKIAVR